MENIYFLLMANARAELRNLLGITKIAPERSVGDPLWFAAWTPGSNGAVLGACVALMLLAVFQRLLVGARGVLEMEWKRQ